MWISLTIYDFQCKNTHESNRSTSVLNLWQWFSDYCADTRGGRGTLLCVLAYLVGSVIRYNIKHVEPLFASRQAKSTLSLERFSDLALVGAYIISVCLYLYILSSFYLISSATFSISPVNLKGGL